jgi:hypothetical protein
MCPDTGSGWHRARFRRRTARSHDPYRVACRYGPHADVLYQRNRPDRKLGSLDDDEAMRVPRDIRLSVALASAALDRHLLDANPPLSMTPIDHHRRVGRPAIGILENRLEHDAVRPLDDEDIARAQVLDPNNTASEGQASRARHVRGGHLRRAGHGAESQIARSLGPGCCTTDASSSLRFAGQSRPSR